MGLRRILTLILQCLNFSTCDEEVSELFLCRGLRCRGLNGFEEDINLDFAVLELQHLRCRVHEFVRLRCCCCSMSRGEMLLLPVEHWLR